MAEDELSHWTGHNSRLDRKISNGFGSNDNAREESVAEVPSALIGGELGLPVRPRLRNRHAASLLTARILEVIHEPVAWSPAEAVSVEGLIVHLESLAALVPLLSSFSVNLGARLEARWRWGCEIKAWECGSAWHARTRAGRFGWLPTGASLKILFCKFIY